MADRQSAWPPAAHCRAFHGAEAHPDGRSRHAFFPLPLHNKNGMPDDRAIAISATFTAESIQPGLGFWAAHLGLNYEIRFAPYGQLFQQLLDPGGLFARNRGGFNVALVRFEDWRAAGMDASIARLIDAVRVAAAFPSPLILVVCPATSACQAEFPAQEAALCAGIADMPGVFYLSAGEIEARYPVAEVHDPRAAELGHLPYTPEFFVALATAVARRIHAIAVPPRKVIALDCDDTLWKGVCGEDGPDGIVIDPPRLALQQFMAGKGRAGYLLVLCSRNNDADVAEAFRAHAEMPLRFGDFVAHRINWEPKDANLGSLASELDLALDSFIFVDDDPKECTQVQSALPEVLAIPLPREDSAIPSLLDHIWAFDRARVTDEDRRRPELYAQRAERVRAERAAASLEEFLASLDLHVAIAPMADHELTRVAQLTARTSQMNTSCARRTESDLRALCAQPGWQCQTVNVRDRFGDYGLTGVLLFRADAGSLAVDTFLLSCRALGRGVEQRMIARLGEIAREMKLPRISIPFRVQARNQPALQFLKSLAEPDGDGVFTLPADAAASCGAGWQPANRLPVDPGERGSPSACGRPPIDYLEIATSLRTPQAVLSRIQSARRSGPLPEHRAIDPPRTPLEGQLAEIWAGLLNLSAVGIHENFFDLGGHSLLAVQLLSRVGQMFGVDLSLEVVYTGEFTVAELANAIELKEIEQAGGNYHQLIEELDRLSDDEVRALLAEEQESGGA